MKRSLLFLMSVVFVLFSCKEQEARRPKQKSTANFYKELIKKNKEFVRQENKHVEAYFKADTLNVYKTSNKGYWYTYKVKVEEKLPFPKSGDLVKINFNITDLEGDEIYPNQIREYKVEKEDFIPALEDGVKRMKKGETVTFLIPSYRAFGVVGDGNKIKGSQTIKSTVTLINLNEQNENK